MTFNSPPGDSFNTADDAVKHTCLTCKRVKHLPMFYDNGGWFYFTDEHTDDAYCCGQEMEVEDA